MSIPRLSLECHALSVPLPTGFLGRLTISRNDGWLGHASGSGFTVTVQVAVLSLWLLERRHESCALWLERLRTRTVPSHGGIPDGR
ncbi:hypothetical protein [Natrarchaeobaculum sulfurireducens]|uniref:Uncharacterized protein n=1 Tax=Natrarchaeobaculum sulfurireducens TaxID=2044521 RepID=A0A346PBD2_9EURY|nr:hypothetical protein [Natrarchaeobaculum sulfurireducens]AXR76827.1 hypothetical protein AArc1_0483 [Natrarchaeobaculum sulfurireducens]